MSSHIFSIENGVLHFADKLIIQNLEIYLYLNNRICLIGRNGSGKSSLLKLIYGIYTLDAGKIYQSPEVKIAYLNQENQLPKDKTVSEIIYSHAKEPYYGDMFIDHLQLDKNQYCGEISGGQQRRVALAAILSTQADILLLDEPTNHLDVGSIEWLEQYLKSYKGSVICVSHDRSFLNNITNKVWWLYNTILRKSDKGFESFETWQEEVLSAEERQLVKLNKQLSTEESWLHGGVTARRKRNQKRLSNLRFLKEDLRSKQKTTYQAKVKSLELSLKLVKKSHFIIEAENISFGYEKKILIKDFSLRVIKGEKIGIIGPNGCGKSTLIKVLLQLIPPFEGRVKQNENLNISYFDQNAPLNLESTVAKLLCPGEGEFITLTKRSLHAASYIKQFMFDPRVLYDKVGTLSGGQRCRLSLAKILINPGNLLILDEPTNDLDMESLDMLLDILHEYTGTLLIVSHDRDFLDRLVTRSLVLTKEGKYLI